MLIGSQMFRQQHFFSDHLQALRTDICALLSYNCRMILHYTWTQRISPTEYSFLLSTCPYISVSNGGTYIVSVRAMATEMVARGIWGWHALSANSVCVRGKIVFFRSHKCNSNDDRYMRRENYCRGRSIHCASEQLRPPGLPHKSPVEYSYALTLIWLLKKNNPIFIMWSMCCRGQYRIKVETEQESVLGKDRKPTNSLTFQIQLINKVNLVCWSSEIINIITLFFNLPSI